MVAVLEVLMAPEQAVLLVLVLALPEQPVQEEQADFKRWAPWGMCLVRTARL